MLVKILISFTNQHFSGSCQDTIVPSILHLKSQDMTANISPERWEGRNDQHLIQLSSGLKLVQGILNNKVNEDQGRLKGSPRFIRRKTASRRPFLRL